MALMRVSEVLQRRSLLCYRVKAKGTHIHIRHRLNVT